MCFWSLFLSFFILFRFVCFVLFSFVLCRFVLFRFVSFRFVSFRFVLFRFVSFHFVLFCAGYSRPSANYQRVAIGFRLGYEAIGHYKNEPPDGSKSISQWRLGTLGAKEFERGQAKIPRQYNCCVPGCRSSHNYSGVAFFACPVPPNDSKYFCVADPNW